MFDFVALTAILLLIAVPLGRNHSTAQLGVWATLSVFFVLFAFRASNIGNDTHEYIRIFNEINIHGEFEYGQSRYESGYLLLNYILKSWINNPQIIFIVAGAFIYYSFGRFILKYSEIPWLSLFIFLTYGFFTFTFSALRQGLAMAICIYAFEALMNGRNIRYILLIICATFFHSTAYVFFASYLCKILKPSRKVFFIGYLTAAVLLATFSVVLNYVFQWLPIYELYTLGSYIGETGIAAFLYATLSSAILIFSYNILTVHQQKKQMLNKVYSYGLIMILIAVIIYIVSIKANIFDRIALYFNTLVIILLPNAISKLKGDNRVLVIATVLAVFFTYSAIIISYRPEWMSIFPYSFYWQE